MKQDLYLQNLPPSSQFPVDALPATLYELALELQRNTKAPWELIAASLMSSMSQACQGSVNVQVPNGISAPSPTSIYLTTLIASGGGKTTLDKLVGKPVGEFEVKQAEYLKTERIKYKSAMIAWNIKKKAIEKSIEKAEKNGVNADQSAVSPDDKRVEDIEDSDIPLDEKIEVSLEQITGDYIDQLKEQLTQHLSQEPKRPRNVKLMYSNASPSALLRSLYENWQSASLSSDEAGGIFNGQVLADLAMINKLWEGGTIHVERIDSESFILRDARLTLSLMVQPKVFRKYLERRGDEARAIGLFARCFICCPISSLGTRFIGHVPPVWQHLPKFHARVTELLEQNMLELEDTEFTRRTLAFSPDAKQLWINAFNEVESYLYPGEYFADIADYGAKFGENLARLAALFHFFEGEQGDISYETTNRALAICRWYMTEFKRLFSSQPEIPLEVSDAGLIEPWLAFLLRTNCCHSLNGILYVKKNDILQSGPNPVRNKFRLDAALNYMACCNRVRIVKFKKTNYVELNYQYFINLIGYLQSQGGANYLGQPPMLPSGR
jgi:hypothetical protein